MTVHSAPSFLSKAKNFLFGSPVGTTELPVVSKNGRAPDLQAITSYFNRQLARQQQDIAKLTKAMQQAEVGMMTSRLELIRTYKDLVLDSHLTALMEQRKSALLSRKFTLMAGGKDITAKLDQYWFYKFLEYAWEADAYGYSLIGLGDIVGGELTEVKLLERHLVNPDEKQYLRNPYVATDIDLTSEPHADWYILVGEPKNLGWLAKAGYHVISKKFVFTSYDEYAMVFGVPIRVAYLDSAGDADKEEMSEKLYNMGPAGVITLSKEDEFELHGGGQSAGSSYQIFTEHIKLRNSELSKLVVGQTMTTDDGSSRSQGEVHERVAGNIQAMDMRWIKHVVNRDLLPRLAKLGILPQGARFDWEQDELLDLMDQKDVDDMLLRNGYNLPDSYIMEKYGVPVEGRTLPNQGESDPGGPPGKLKPQGPAAPKGQGTEPHSNFILEQAVSVFREARSTYTIHPHSCGCGDAENKKKVAPESNPSIFDEAYLESVLQDFFHGKYLRNKLPEDLYFKTATYLFEGVAQGYGGQPVKFDWGTPDREMIEALSNNIHIFSGAKTYQQRLAYNALLKTPEGRVRDWAEFKKEAMPLAKDYNINYLRAEYQAATGQARMCSKWVDIEKDKDVFPLLRYSTVGDANVREAHKKLDGIVRKVDDPFWDRYMPKNGWGCRCDVEKLEKGDAEITSLKHFGELGPKDQPRAFRFNPGKKKMIFDQNHPYFKIVDMDHEWAKDNFDLPIPEPELPKISGITPMGTPVSQAVEIKSPDLESDVNYALRLIDNIHGDGIIPKFPVTFDSDNNGELGYFQLDRYGMKPVKINLTKGKKIELDTILHEFGHLVDAAASGFKTFSTYEPNSPFRRFIIQDLVKTSPIQELIRIHATVRANPSIDPYGQIMDGLDYFLDPAEVFARAYHQYILHKSGFDYGKRLLSATPGTMEEFAQWRPAEFEKFIPNFEVALREMKWIH